MPYEFKIKCHQEVRSLFPPDYCPLHAGFGNRHSVSTVCVCVCVCVFGVEQIVLS